MGASAGASDLPGLCRFPALQRPGYSSFLFGGVTFGGARAGARRLFAARRVFGIAGGSLAQVLAPILAGLGFLFWQRDGEPQRDYFALAVAGFWLSFSLHNLALYVGDARRQLLPLLGLSSDPIHDWAYLLGHFGLLHYDLRIAGLIRLAAVLISLFSLGFSAWLLKRMASG